MKSPSFTVPIHLRFIEPGVWRNKFLGAKCSFHCIQNYCQLDGLGARPCQLGFVPLVTKKGCPCSTLCPYVFLVQSWMPWCMHATCAHDAGTHGLGLRHGTHDRRSWVARRTHKWAIGIGLMPITSSSIFTVLCDIIWQYFVDVRAIAILRPSDINWTATDVVSRGFLWSAQACQVDFLRFRCSSSKLSSTMLGWSPVWHCWYSIHYLLVFGWPHFSWNRQKSRLDWTSLHHFICSLRVQRLAGGEPCGSSSRFSRISLVITASTACVRHAWPLRSFGNPASDIIRSYSAICTCFVKYDTVPYLTILTYIDIIYTQITYL